MKKNLLIALFATATMAGAAEATGPKDDGKGNWTIAMDLNETAFYNLIHDTNRKANKQGVNLVSWGGSGTCNGNETYNEKRQVAYWFGWGNEYFYDELDVVGTGVDEGLQMGFVSNKAWLGSAPSTKPGDIADLSCEYVPGSIFPPVPPYYTKAGYYRAHTKLNGLEEEAGPMRLLEGLTSITNATLTLSHDNSGEKSILTQYLTVTGIQGGEEVTISYIASVDDVSTFSGWLEGLENVYPGSARFDVDTLLNVKFDDGEGGLVSKGTVAGSAWSQEQAQSFHAQASAAAVPEPTTATLSLLALAGLCARRRRR